MSKTMKPEISVFVGIDWADDHHDFYAISRDGERKTGQFAHDVDAIENWVQKMYQFAGDGGVAILVEQGRGPLINALMLRDNIELYTVNPKQAVCFRKSFPGEGKTDEHDAYCLARMLVERRSTLIPLVANDKQTRLVDELSRQRRAIVNSQTALRNQLKADLKACFPLVLELFGTDTKRPIMLAFLKRWSDPREARRADKRLLRKFLETHGVRNKEQREEIIEKIRTTPLLCRDEACMTVTAITIKCRASQIEALSSTVKVFDSKIREALKQHPDAKLFTELNGVGPVLGARLLGAFGSEGDRWESADQLASYSGIAPITRKSGKSCGVYSRLACPKYLKQTFHEFADSARIWCPWSKARYKQLKDRGMKHNAAVRKLARSWIRILFRMWKTKTQFDLQKYMESIIRKNPTLIQFLDEKSKKQLLSTC